MRSTRVGAGLVLLGALAVGVVAPARRADAQDVVFKTDGGRLRGKIVSETRSRVVIETPGGTYTIPMEEVARIERSGDVFRELEQRRTRMRTDDLKGWYDLGTWCVNQDLFPQAIDCWNEVLRIEPDHAEARFELGYRRHEGKWVTEAEYFEARGYVRHEDRWVTRDEADKLEAGLLQVGGRWVSRDSPEGRAALGQDEPQVAARGERPGPATPPAAGGRPAGGRPAADGAAPARRNPGFPWGNGPLGGQVGQQALTPEQRAAALAQGKQQGGWAVAFSSTYYDVFSNGPEEEVRTLARTMDLVCEEFKEIFKFEAEITRPFPIHIYGSQQEFMSRTGHGAGTGGFYDGHKIVAFHGKLGGLTTQSVLFHEGTHQFQGLCMGRNMWKAKIWLIEGLAVFFEATEVQGRRVSTGAIPRDRLGNVKRAIQSGAYVKLHDLIRMEQAQFGALHYAHAWSLIYFLVNGTQGGKRRFVEYWERNKAGTPDPVALFEELFDRPMEEIETAWKAYVLGL